MASFVPLTNNRYLNMDNVDYILDAETCLDVKVFDKDASPTFGLARVMILEGEDADIIRDWLKQQGRPLVVYGEAHQRYGENVEFDFDHK